MVRKSVAVATVVLLMGCAHQWERSRPTPPRVSWTQAHGKCWGEIPGGPCVGSIAALFGLFGIEGFGYDRYLECMDDRYGFVRSPPFRRAAATNDVTEVRRLIAESANVNAPSGFGETALGFAAQNGHTEVVKELLAHGAYVNAKDNEGWAPLHLAAQNGHTEVVEELLAYGADVNAKDNGGVTPLDLTAKYGHTEIVKELLAFGADVNAKTNKGYTALHFAAPNGHTEVVEELLAYGADVNAKDNGGVTPLGAAAKYGHTNVIELLRKHRGGVDVQIKGVDDGVRTTKQQDYREAALFAKREAIERAGVKIKTLTTVKDMVLNSDYIESQAEAVLLPGYDVVDMGYSSDGTYQVVLIGKVRTGSEGLDSKERPYAKSLMERRKSKARRIMAERKERERRSALEALGAHRMGEIIGNDGRFVASDKGLVLDSKTGLMWAAKDNGKDIKWRDAKTYCENYRGGGYTDWRMPTQDELAGLYDRNKSYECDSYECDRGYECHLTELIKITACFPWASETTGSLAAVVNFCDVKSLRGGARLRTDASTPSHHRALPVRGGK